MNERFSGNKQRRAATFWLIATLFVAGLLGAQVYRGLDIETNILALLPATEQVSSVERALEQYAESSGRRAIFLIGHTNVLSAMAGADILADALKESPVFKAVTGRITDDKNRAFYDFYFPYREAVSGSALRVLEEPNGAQRFMDGVLSLYYSPMAVAIGELIDEDPLLIFAQFVKSLPPPPGAAQLTDEFLVVEQEGMSYVLVTAESVASPFSRSAQGPIMDVIETAESEARQQFPAIEILHTGVIFFAHLGTQSAEGEVSVIGFGSILGVLFLMWVTFRSPRQIFASLVPIASGLLWATTFSFLLFPNLHMITLGFGASLVGVCVDYSFHYFAEGVRASRKSSDSASVLQRILPGIKLGLITSIMGYAGLLIAPFPGLQQMAVFSSVGLIGAFGTVVCWFPIIARQKPLASDPLVLRAAKWYLGLFQRVFNSTVCRVAALAVLAVLLYGMTKLEGRDDIRLLQQPAPELMENETRIKQLLGGVDFSRFFVVEGETPQAVLESEEKLLRRLAELRDQNTLGYFQGISPFIPSIQTQKQNRERLAEALTDHETSIATGLSNLGFEPEVLDALKQRIRDPEYGEISLDDWLGHPVSSDMRSFWLGQVEDGFASVVLLGNIQDEEALLGVEDEFSGVYFVNKVDDVSDLFRRYRVLSCWLVGLSYLVIALLLLKKYGPGRFARVFAPPLLAAIGTLGMLGLMGQYLTLFNVLALLLVLGIGVDYTIFFAEARVDASSIMFAVFLSGATTILSFGLLALSKTQALRSFGGTVWIGITLALLLSPMVVTQYRQQHDDKTKP